MGLSPLPYQSGQMFRDNVPVTSPLTSGGRVGTGSTLTTGSTQMSGGRTPVPITYTTLALYEEGNLPPQSTPKPPSGGGQCPPGYAPNPSPSPAPSPSPSPIDPRITYPVRGMSEEGAPLPINTLAAICSEDPAFCPTQTYPNQTATQGTQNWGAYNPLTRAIIGNEDPRNYPGMDFGLPDRIKELPSKTPRGTGDGNAWGGAGGKFIGIATR